MDTIEREVCIALAFLWCRKNHPKHPRPFQWAKRHWMEFLTEMNSDTGNMLVRIAHRRRRENDGEQDLSLG